MNINKSWQVGRKQAIKKKDLPTKQKYMMLINTRLGRIYVNFGVVIG